jgi:acyl-coenzyme A thioesterase PaaI-like protein
MVGEKNSRCFVCGPDNGLGLQVPFEQDGPEGSRAVYTARPEHGGWNGILHGGVTFSLMDEALGWALYFQQKPAVTARVNARFNKPIPIGAELIVRAWIIRERTRIVDVRAEVRSADKNNELFAEADASMYRSRSTVAMPSDSTTNRGE